MDKDYRSRGRRHRLFVVEPKKTQHLVRRHMIGSKAPINSRVNRELPSDHKQGLVNKCMRTRVRFLVSNSCLDVQPDVGDLFWSLYRQCWLRQNYPVSH